MIRDEKGQGAIEYILIIGGAVLIAAIVLAVLFSTGTRARSDINQSSGTYDRAQNALENDVNNLIQSNN